MCVSVALIDCFLSMLLDIYAIKRKLILNSNKKVINLQNAQLSFALTHIK